MSVSMKRSGSERMESQWIRVSGEGQIQIPRNFFEKLNIKDVVECFIRNDELVLRPIRETNDDFSEEILKDLVDQGFSGHELIEEFRKRKSKIRAAVLKMIEEADELARQPADHDEVKELFEDTED